MVGTVGPVETVYERASKEAAAKEFKQAPRN
jgi:hypothetical protein